MLLPCEREQLLGLSDILHRFSNVLGIALTGPKRCCVRQPVSSLIEARVGDVGASFFDAIGHAAHLICNQFRSLR